MQTPVALPKQGEREIHVVMRDTVCNRSGIQGVGARKTVGLIKVNIWNKEHFLGF
jgi:hypothetical protein